MRSAIRNARNWNKEDNEEKSAEPASRNRPETAPSNNKIKNRNASVESQGDVGSGDEGGKKGVDKAKNFLKRKSKAMESQKVKFDIFFENVLVELGKGWQ